MHVGWSALFAPHRERNRPSAESLSESIAGRLHLAPRFRQRLACATAAFSEPFWVDDAGFDLSRT